MDLRDPDVAAARREPAGGADQARPRRCSRAPRRWGRSTTACRSPPRPCARAARATRSSRRRAGAAWRRSCSAPRSRRDPRRRAPGRPRRAARELRAETITQVRRRARRSCRVIVTAPGRARLAVELAGGRIGRAPPSSNLPLWHPRADVRPDRRRRPRRLGGRQVARSPPATRCRCSTRTRSRTSGSTPAQSQSWEDAGGQFTVGTALETDALIQAGHRARRRLHRLDRRRQHEPR